MTDKLTCIFSILEAFVIIVLATNLIGIKNIAYKRCMTATLIMGIISYLGYLFSPSYIINPISYVVVLTILLCTILKSKNYFECIIGSCITITFYVLIEFLNVTILSTIYNIDPSTLATNIPLRFAWFIPQITVILALTFVINKNNLNIFNRNTVA